MTPSTNNFSTKDPGLSPEIVKELEMAISQRLNPQKAILKGMQNLREYAIREGLTDDVFYRSHDGPAAL